MKIVMLCDFYGDGQTYQENMLSKYYNLLGHKVVIVASTTENLHDYVQDIYDKELAEKIYFDSFGSKVYRKKYSWNFKNKIKKFPNILSILKSEMPDFILVHDIHFNLKEAVQYKKRINKDCIIKMDYHADYSNSAKNWISLNILHKLIRKNFLNLYINFLDKIYPVVPESMNFLNEVYGVDKSKMELLPLGYDQQMTENIQNDLKIENIKSKYGLPVDSKVIITGGKISKSKKTDIVISALQAINDNNFYLIVFGSFADVDYENELKQMSEELNVIFTGWLDSTAILEVMAVADIAVFPASQSVLWQQAIGMGLPLIAGDIGGQDMSYLNRYNNLVKINKQDITADVFARNILEILKDDHKSSLMREGAMKTAKEYLSYQQIAQKSLA